VLPPQVREVFCRTSVGKQLGRAVPHTSFGERDSGVEPTKRYLRSEVAVVVGAERWCGRVRCKQICPQTQQSVLFDDCMDFQCSQTKLATYRLLAKG